MLKQLLEGEPTNYTTYSEHDYSEYHKIPSKFTSLSSEISKLLVSQLQDVLRSSISSLYSTHYPYRLEETSEALLSSQTASSIDEILTNLEAPIKFPKRTKRLIATIRITGRGKPTPVTDQDLEP